MAGSNIRSHCYTPAMRIDLKTFLLWLMIATLPLQGLSAAMKMSCAPAHHASVQVSVPAHENHHAGAAGEQGGHGGAHHATSGDSETSSTSVDNHHLKNTSCSACAACCVGATAPPPAITPMAVHSDSSLVVVTTASFVTGTTPDGLERPPKRS